MQLLPTARNSQELIEAATASLHGARTCTIFNPQSWVTLFSKFLVEDRAVEPDAVCISAALSSLYPPQCAQTSLLAYCAYKRRKGSKTLKYKELENEHRGPLATGKVLAAQTPSIVMCCVALKAASSQTHLCRGPAALGGCQGSTNGLGGSQGWNNSRSTKRYCIYLQEDLAIPDLFT